MTQKILIYSTPTCPWCKKAKDFFTEKGIKFTNIDVDADVKAAEEMVKKTGQMGVPVIDIDGEIIIGFDQEKIEKILGV